MSITASLASLPVIGALLSRATTTNVLATLAGGVVLLFLYLYPYREYTLSFRNLPGPKPTHWFWGNLREIIKAPPMAEHEKWITEYGTTIRYRVVFGEARLFSADPGFLSYILQHSDDFIKPERTNRVLNRLLGEGVLTAEGSVHRRQRRVLNPAFSPAAVRDMADIMFDKAFELERKLASLVDDDTEKASETPAKPEDQVAGARKIDVMKFLGQCTLDVIGAAGFDYNFNSLSEKGNELAEAFRQMFSVGQEITPFVILQNFVPIFEYIPTKRQAVIDRSSAITRRIGQELVDSKKAAIQAQINGELEKGDDIGKDLLSLLMRANMSPDLRADQKLTNDEVIAQITTFMLAGNETSSTALTWVLYRLAMDQSIQTKLREECQSFGDDHPTIDKLNTLKYLDKVVHESLRYDPPVPGTIREAVRDHVVPLSKPVMGRDGKIVETVTVKKGVQTFIPIMNVNRSTEIWGPDAGVFNPDRFDMNGIPTANVPGVYGNLLSFLGGARNCIGYRLAIAEIKIILFVLIRSLKFEELPSKPVIEAKSSIVMRPRIVGEESAGLQMPLLVRHLDD